MVGFAVASGVDATAWYPGVMQAASSPEASPGHAWDVLAEVRIHLTRETNGALTGGLYSRSHSGGGKVTDADRLLIAAFQEGDDDAIKRAIREGANPNTVINGFPVLHMAAIGGDPALVDVMLTAGADPNAREAQHGQTALAYLAWIGSSPEHEAAVNRLVQAGADLNAPDREGRLPLDLSARVGNRRMARVLTVLGAKCSVTSRVVLRDLLDEPNRGTQR